MVVRTRGFKALVRAIYRIFLRSAYFHLINKRFVKTCVFDFKLWIDLCDRGISRTLWLYGERELDHKWILEKVVWPGARILDVGANIGYYAVMESLLVGEQGEVVALEPSPENFKLFEKNLRLNDCQNITAQCIAISNKTEVREFFLAKESNLNTFYEPILLKRGNLARNIQVQAVALTDFVSQCGEFDFLRMDIEGHEVFVLEEIISLAKSGKRCPSIIFEAHINAYGPNQDIVPVLQDLEDCGFTIPLVASSNQTGTKLLEGLGKVTIKTIPTDETVRTIHENLSFEQLGRCITQTGGIRTIFLRAPD